MSLHAAGCPALTGIIRVRRGGAPDGSRWRKATLFRFHWSAAGVACLLLSLGGAGCGGTPEPIKQEADGSYQHLKIIGSAYLRASADLGRPPENAKEILPYIHYKGEGGAEAVLRSPNDGLEYKILWSVSRDDMEPRASGRFPVLAYEQQGRDGWRYVLCVKNIEPMTDEQLKKAPFPPGHKNPF
jgi:hypothetical protein